MSFTVIQKKILDVMREILSHIVRPMHYGLEWELPRISDVLKTNFFLPIVIYFITLQILGYLVKQLLWINYLSLTRHRLQNLTVSLVHSCITGCCSLIFFITHPIVIIFSSRHWDVIRNDSSWHAIVILAHHTVVYSIFSVGMLSHKFLPYTYWALLVEINTSFLHVRSIIRLTNRDPCKNLCYKTISLLAFLTFFVFRLGTLLWMMLFMVVNYSSLLHIQQFNRRNYIPSAAPTY
uniref:TLC domain-containing protein n=1 Tax=Wuchereria bancrofti TaxID=6293 RepID=A0A1I8F078_WUCBA